jgi:hypothetical protein
VIPGATAGTVNVAEQGDYDDNLSVAANRLDPLQVGDGGRHGDLVGDYDLNLHMVNIVLQLPNLGDDAVVGLAEADVCQGKRLFLEPLEGVSYRMSLQLDESLRRLYR